MKFDVERLRENSKADYEKAWLESGNLIEKEGNYFSLKADKGESHQLFDLIQEIRRVLIDLGFEEVVVPMLIEKDQIERQYGPQAPVILDRIFFLAGLDRSDLGIGKEDLGKIREEIPDFDGLDRLENILRNYKKGEISADDLVEVLTDELELDEGQASYVLSQFEDFKELRPIPSDMTLRSHTTAGWFPILKEMRFRKSLPIQLFTVGPKYRREQKLDDTHLYRSWTASLAVMAEEISLEDGRNLVKQVLKSLGFSELKCEIKKATSKYYAPDTEFEVFAEHPATDEMIEIGNAGFYSPVSLANYEIEYPVFNFGMGLERILMIRSQEGDIRKIVYPYKYKDMEFSDKQLSEMLIFKKEPETETGRQIARRIVSSAEEHKDMLSPCEVEIFKGDFYGKKVRVNLIEPEENTKLIGPAAFNEIFVYDGNIIGLPPRDWNEDESLREVRSDGFDSRITYIQSLANLAARRIEEAIEGDQGEVQVRVPIVESLSDVNLKLEGPALRYITDNQKNIDIRGPVFTTISAGFEDNCGN